MLDDWGWSDPGTLLGVPSPPLSEGRPLLAVSGSSRGWPACVSSSHTWEARMWSAIAGTRDQRPVRASVLLSRVLTEAGVAPAVHLRGPAPLAASPMQPASESGRDLQNSLCPAGRGEQTPTPVIFATSMDTLGHADAPAACTVMDGSGFAGCSVKEDACRREEQAHHGRKCTPPRSTGLEPSRCSQPAVST